MKLHGLIIYLLLFAPFGFSYAQDKSVPQDTAKRMSVKELKTDMKKDPSLVILDVRTPEELKGPLGQINNVVNIPVQQLEGRINELDKYKNKNIAVICRSGVRSLKAQNILSKHGFKSKSVDGGMAEYRKEEEKK